MTQRMHICGLSAQAHAMAEAHPDSPILQADMSAPTGDGTYWQRIITVYNEAFDRCGRDEFGLEDPALYRQD